MLDICSFVSSLRIFRGFVDSWFLIRDSHRIVPDNRDPFIQQPCRPLLNLYPLESSNYPLLVERFQLFKPFLPLLFFTLNVSIGASCFLRRTYILSLQ